MDTEEYNSLHKFLSSDPNNRVWPSYVISKNEKSNFRKKVKKFILSEGTLLYDHKSYGYVRAIKDTEKDAILKGCHTDPLAGHQGITRTAKKIRERYFWTGMETDIRNYIRHCDKCQCQNHLSKASAELHPIPIKDKAFDMLGLDLVGPLHTTKSGSKYIAVLTDYFTKWPEVKAIPSKHSSHIAEFIIEVICRHGTPSDIITDRGREFCNKVNKILCQKLNINHKVTSPYHPQSNGLTERFNQTLCNALKKYVNDEQDDWDQYIQQVAFAARTCQQKSTKQTPFFLVYGRKATLPIELDIPVSTTQNDLTDEEVLDNRIQSFVHLLKTHQDTKEEIKKAQATQKAYHDRQNIKPFIPGQLVLVRNSKRVNRNGDKMVHTWTGPFVISEYLGKGVYKVRGRKTVLNIKNLKVYYQPEPKTQPKPVKKTVNKQVDLKKNTAKKRSIHLTTSVRRTLKSLKQLTTQQKCHNRLSGPSAKPLRQENFQDWLKLITTSQLRSMVQKCMQYKLPNSKNITEFTTAASCCPCMSLYLKWQKESPEDLDHCTTLIAEQLKPRPFSSKVVDPVKSVPAMMLTSAVLIEAYNSKQLPEDIMSTLEQVPLGYSVQSKFHFYQTKRNQCLHVANYALTAADLKTLMPNQWLSDQIVMAFLSLVTKETNNKDAFYSYVLPSFLALKWETGDYSSWIFQKESLEMYKIILMPVCYQHHWFLLVAKPQMFTVSILDSKMNAMRQNRFIQPWRMFMQARHEAVKQAPLHWTGEQIQTSQQTDGDSCGVFVLMNSVAVLHQKPPTIMRQCHVDNYRKFVKHKLFTNSISRP